jgi:hypothetical protein
VQVVFHAAEPTRRSLFWGFKSGIESAAVPFEIIALQHHPEVGGFMLMPGHVAGRRLSQLGKGARRPSRRAWNGE